MESRWVGSTFFLRYLGRALRSRSLASVLEGRDNNLNLIRMLAATAVLISHAFALTSGREELEPFRAATGGSLGTYAVAIFFGISGLLIARSFERRRSIVHFGVSRFLRLYPALLVVLLVCTLAGAAFSILDPATYYRANGTLTYVPRNLSLAFLQYELPGVFSSNPLGNPVNGSLWTLFYEVICYFVVVMVGCAGLLKRRGMFLVFLAGVILAHLWAINNIPLGGFAAKLHNLASLGLPFALGTAAYLWRDHLPLNLPVAALLWLPVILSAGTVYMTSAIVVAVVYATFWIGFVPGGPIRRYNQLGDYSYGMYIYAYPVQQAAIAIWPGHSTLANISASLPVTLLLAALSWKLVEERALGHARPLSDKLLEFAPRRRKDKNFI